MLVIFGDFGQVRSFWSVLTVLSILVNFGYFCPFLSILECIETPWIDSCKKCSKKGIKILVPHMPWQYNLWKRPGVQVFFWFSKSGNSCPPPKMKRGNFSEIFGQMLDQFLGAWKSSIFTVYCGSNNKLCNLGLFWNKISAFYRAEGAIFRKIWLFSLKISKIWQIFAKVGNFPGKNFLEKG